MYAINSYVNYDHIRVSLFEEMTVEHAKFKSFSASASILRLIRIDNYCLSIWHSIIHKATFILHVAQEAPSIVES
jgi:hypothetical protein